MMMMVSISISIGEKNEGWRGDGFDGHDVVCKKQDRVKWFNISCFFVAMRSLVELFAMNDPNPQRRVTKKGKKKSKRVGPELLFYVASYRIVLQL